MQREQRHTYSRLQIAILSRRAFCKPLKWQPNKLTASVEGAAALAEAVAAAVASLIPPPHIANSYRCGSQQPRQTFHLNLHMKVAKATPATPITPTTLTQRKAAAPPAPTWRRVAGGLVKSRVRVLAFSRRKGRE